jgi:hypothetical protein
MEQHFSGSSDLSAPAQTMAEDAYISALEVEFPRIMKEVLERWGTPLFEPYTKRLIIDERGGRKGFSPQVLSELLFLYSIDMFSREFDPQEMLSPLGAPGGIVGLKRR